MAISLAASKPRLSTRIFLHLGINGHGRDVLLRSCIAIGTHGRSTRNGNTPEVIKRQRQSSHFVSTERNGNVTVFYAS